MNRLAPLLAIVFLLVACSTLPTERQLVGTWTDHLKETFIRSESGVEHSYSKQMVDLHLTSDHRLVFWVRGERTPDSIGHWRLDGGWLCIEFTRRNEHHRINHSYRLKITRLSPHELLYVQSSHDPAEDGIKVHLTRRSSEPLAGPRSSF
jgi:hypothetical protein